MANAINPVSSLGSVDGDPSTAGTRSAAGNQTSTAHSGSSADTVAVHIHIPAITPRVPIVTQTSGPADPDDHETNGVRESAAWSARLGSSMRVHVSAIHQRRRQR
jgi:hypothetical protein